MELTESSVLTVTVLLQQNENQNQPKGETNKAGLWGFQMRTFCCFLPMKSEHVALLACQRVSVLRVLPVRWAYRNFGVQSFYWCFIVDVWLIELLAMWLSSISQAPSPLPYWKALTLSSQDGSFWMACPHSESPRYTLSRGAPRVPV